jgi:hypothetical protein
VTRVAALALLLLGSSGCCASPWSRYPRRQLPDESYSLGGATHGFDVYVWRCVDGQRIVVSQYSAEMTCQAAQQETVACGAETAFERAHAEETRQPVRASRNWR